MIRLSQSRISHGFQFRSDSLNLAGNVSQSKPDFSRLSILWKTKKTLKMSLSQSRISHGFQFDMDVFFGKRGDVSVKAGFLTAFNYI